MINYFKANIILNEKIDPTSSRHWFGADNSVFATWVPYLNGHWLGHEGNKSEWVWSGYVWIVLVEVIISVVGPFSL